MKSHDDTNPDHKPVPPLPRKSEKRAEAERQAPIDFAKLDLTIEKVEERISPSETNVFDK